MKSDISLSCLIVLLAFLLSCKRDPVALPDTGGISDPADTTAQRNFSLVLENLPAGHEDTRGLSASLTVEKAKSPSQIIHISTPVTFDQKHHTGIIKLAKGDYKIIKLILSDGSGTTRFATPVAGAVKASLVSRPLSIPLTLQEKVDKEIKVEMLPVSTADTPENFGYPKGTFGGRPENPEEPAMDKRIFIRAMIKVGEVVYDSIPAQLIVKSWNAKEEMNYSIHYLSAGTQAILLPAKAVRYHLSISKWGVYDELTMTKDEVQENTLYDLGGYKAAKKLKSVIETMISEGKTRPHTKTDYSYHADGKPKQRLVWGKRADMSNYLMQKDMYEYTGRHITSILSYGENDVLQKTLVARYDNEGRVNYLEDTKESEKMTATAYYLPLETRSGISRDYRIDVQYVYGNGRFNDYYSKTMRGGSVLHDIYVSSNGSREEGTYDYDFCVNPYVHLGVPDMQFSQYTRHNIVFPRKIWQGAHLQHEPYDYKYTYDAEGYPTGLLTKFRARASKADTFTLRTLFEYER